ncbi:MAG: SPOR domain-containing protein [Gammaproteobacteria bacterium]
MSEQSDSRILDLYQQLSQETPPAHIDRAVLDRARNTVRPRAFSPFGNHWVAGGALASMVMLSVLLILVLTPQQDGYAPGRDAMAPASDALPAMQLEAKSTQADDTATVLDAPAPSSHALAQTKSATAASRPQSRALAGNALAPSGDAASGLPTGVARGDATLSAPQMKTEQRRQMSAMSGARFNFTDKSRAADAAMPEEEARPDIRWEPAVPRGLNTIGGKSQDNEAVIAEKEAPADIRREPAIPTGLNTIGEKSQDNKAAIAEKEAPADIRREPAIPTGLNTLGGKSQHDNVVIAEKEAPADILREPVIPTGRGTFNEELQAGVAAMSVEETRAPGQQAAVPAREEPAGTTAQALPATWYLQVGAFREEQRAIVLKKKLSRMGFKNVIQQVSLDDQGVYHRLRVGPFSNPGALERTRLKLFALGIKSRTLEE